ncbi:MAG TPA: peptide chain release factor 1 [Planctomycetota bacterium]|jgi:peptide chain release factor 1|nr:peptide chain release factor 1 [Planctomycetota bacterium]
MLDQIKQKAARFDQIEKLIQDPAVTSQPAQYAALMKERGQLLKSVQPYKDLESVQKQKAEAEALLADPDMKAEAEAEVATLAKRESELLAALEELALSSDETSSRSVIMELRPGVGGEEASLFAGELLEMYTRFAKKKGWDIQLMDVVRSDLGGLKYGTIAIEGEDVYKFLKFETGAHRVQRVPVTEASGRIQTSIATVAVLPQAEDLEIDINPQDVRTDTYSAGGPGGQHVNKTQSAVRLTHIPTNIVVQCQDQRSQTRNRELAWKALKTKLYEHFEEQKAKERRDLRRTQVGTGDRSDKIRTYNFPDSRVTDVRLGASGSVHNLEGFLQGDMDELMDRLLKYEREEKLKALAKKA